MIEDHIAVKIDGVLYVKFDDVKPMRDCIEKLERENNDTALHLYAFASRIEKLEAALREITWIATPDHEEARHKATEIARKALEGKDD